MSMHPKFDAAENLTKLTKSTEFYNIWKK